MQIDKHGIYMKKEDEEPDWQSFPPFSEKLEKNPVFPKSAQIASCFLPALFSSNRYNDYSSSPPAAKGPHEPPSTHCLFPSCACPLRLCVFSISQSKSR